MLLLFLSAVLASELTILGPGALAAADPGVLEAVAARRISNGWQLSQEPGDYEVLVAVADCRQLDRSGWLIADGLHSALVVDCEANVHRGQMDRRGLLADVNRGELGHLKGWLILR